MSNLSPTAALIWSDYIEQVRLALITLSDDEQHEVISELESHLAEETAAEPGPVSESAVQAVIARLGTAKDIAEGYGLTNESPASLSAENYSLIVISLIAVTVGVVFPLLEIVTVPIAAIASRIAVSSPDVQSSPYRFAAYPGLIMGYLALILIILAWPLAFIMPLAATGGFLPRLLLDREATLLAGSTEYWLLVWAAFIVVVAVWWLCLSRIFKNMDFKPEKVFFPFARFHSSKVEKTLTIGAAVLIVVAVTMGIFA